MVQRFYIIYHRNGSISFFVLPLHIFISGYLGKQHLHGSPGVCLGGVGVHNLFIAVKLIGSLQRALLHLVKNILHVNKMTVIQIK